MNRFSVTFSDDLDREIDKAVAETGSNKNEILRKALQLYLAARDGKKHDLKVGLVDSKSNLLKVEIVGL